MSVLIEAISVIVREDAIQQKYSTGMVGFLSDIPNHTHCSDGYLSRIGFMVMEDALAYVSELVRAGLCFDEDRDDFSDIGIAMQGFGVIVGES